MIQVVRLVHHDDDSVPETAFAYVSSHNAPRLYVTHRTLQYPHGNCSIPMVIAVITMATTENSAGQRVVQHVESSYKLRLSVV